MAVVGGEEGEEGPGAVAASACSSSELMAVTMTLLPPDTRAAEAIMVVRQSRERSAIDDGWSLIGSCQRLPQQLAAESGYCCRY